ncbi:MAG: disulfide bond formation protein B [Gammaproteobacteria bacterium]
MIARRHFALISLTCAGLLGYAYYSQYALGYEPCPLCIFQRIGVFLVGLVGLVAAIHGPGRIGRRVYGGVASMFATAGAVVAGRHLWLQSLPPDQVPDCGPGLDYMLEVFPLLDAFRMVFEGSGECAEVDWALLGLSMPGWVLIAFVGLGVYSLWAGFKK